MADTFSINDRLNRVAGNALLKNNTGAYSTTGNIVISGAGFFVGNVVGNITGNLAVPGANTYVLYNNNGNSGASAGFVFNSAANAMSVTGNSTSGNLLTGGLISAGGNITAANISGGNLLAAGLSLSSNVLSAINSTSNITTTANISGGNITGTSLLGSVVSASANITGGNITTGGLISATGNILTSGNVGIGITPSYSTLHVKGDWVAGNSTVKSQTITSFASGGVTGYGMYDSDGTRKGFVYINSSGMVLESASGIPILVNPTGNTNARFDSTGLSVTGTNLSLTSPNTTSNVVFSMLPTGGSYDAFIEMNGESANILVEGFQVQYRNNVGDVQLKQTYSGLTGSTPAIRFSTGVTANAVVIGAGGNLTVAGNLKINTSTPGNFGSIAASWAGSTIYPTLFSDDIARWVMHINPHVSYTASGTNGYTGGMTGATLRMASDTAATTYWDVGVGTNSVGTDKFSIGRSGTSRLFIDSGGNVGVNTTSPTTTFSVNGTTILSNPGAGNYNENLRAPRSPTNSYSCIAIACDTSAAGSVSGQFNLVVFPPTASPGAAGNGAFTIRNNNNDAFAISTSGSVYVTGALSKGSGSFRIDHPLPSLTDTHELVHSFIEGPQADLIYRGVATLVNGTAIINIDSASGMTDGTFVLLCRNVQCFTSNETDWDAVKGSVTGNTLTITCQNANSVAKVSWLVIGERQDKHMYETDWTDKDGKVIVEPVKTAKHDYPLYPDPDLG